MEMVREYVMNLEAKISTELDLMKIEELKKQLSTAKNLEYNQNELHEELNGNNEPFRIKVLQENVNNYKRQLGLVESTDIEQALVSQAEIASQQARDNVFNQFDSISAGGFTVSLRELTKSEGDYQILSAWIQEVVSAQAEQHSNEKDALRNSYERQIESYTEDLESLSILRSKVFELKNQLDDEQSKHDAAANRALEAEEEAKRLNEEIKTLREQLEKPKEPVLTNTSANLAELMKQRELAKPAITNLRWKDELRKNAYLATLVSTNEEIEFGVFDKGLYREVTTEEAERFRAEQQEQAETVTETVEVPALDIEPPSIQVSDEVNAVQGDTIITKVVFTAEEVTEKLNDFEDRLKALEVVRLRSA